MGTTTNRILTAPEAADLLRISVRTLDRLCATDRGLRKIKISTRRVGFFEHEIAAYLATKAAA